MVHINSCFMVLSMWVFVNGLLILVHRSPASSLNETGRRTPLRMATFNIQIFGQKKMQKPHVVKILLKILKRYDAVFIQEIRDNSNTSFVELKDLLNKGRSRRQKYATFISDRLGNSQTKEQFGVIYKNDKIKLVETYQYPDEKNFFERPPLAVHLQLKRGDKFGFLIVINHITPKNVYGELQHLYKIVPVIQKHLQTQQTLIIGDMNAGCGYLSKKKLHALDIYKDKSFKWFIGDKNDTTVAKSDCAYDRVIATGEKLIARINAKSVKSFKFDEEYQISHELAKQVSDHYPVEFVLTRY